MKRLVTGALSDWFISRFIDVPSLEPVKTGIGSLNKAEKDASGADLLWGAM